VIVRLLRHGQSTWNLDRRVQGQQDPPLTELGREQARESVAALTGAGALLSSDLRRARETADILGSALGVPVVITPLLREQGLGVLEGLTTEEALHRAGEHDWRDPDAAVPGGESLRTVYARLVPLATSIRAGEHGDDVALVTHGDTLRVAVCLLAGRPVTEIADPVVGNGEVVTIKMPVHRQQSGTI